MAHDGYDLVLVARRKEELKKIASESPIRKVFIIEKDLSLPDAPKAVYNEIKEAGIVVDILVNNA